MGTDFVSLEAASGIALLLGAAAALIWANTDTTGYASWWGRTLTIGSGDLAITETLVHWVNDALMTIFFFVVGLEIKRELVTGELRETSRAALPAIAAIGGMVVPAVVYVLLNLGGTGLDGWAIPMATDIAFAVGVLAILGARVPSSLKVFLLTLAIVDDIGAIIVIALFYSSGVEPLWLLGGVAVVVLVLLMSRLGIDRPLAYVIPGALLWLCLYEAGIEATLAGVVLGLLTPALPRRGRPVLERLESALHPVSSFVIVPLFALANAGVVLIARRDRPRVGQPGDHRRRGGPRRRQVRRHLRRVGARAAPPHRSSPGRPRARAHLRRGHPGGHRLHRVAVHHRPGLPGSGHRRRQDRGPGRVRARRPHRNGGPAGRAARRRDAATESTRVKEMQWRRGRMAGTPQRNRPE